MPHHTSPPRFERSRCGVKWVVTPRWGSENGGAVFGIEDFGVLWCLTTPHHTSPPDQTLSTLITIFWNQNGYKWVHFQNVSLSGYKNDDPFGIEPNEHQEAAFKLPFSGRGPTYLHAWNELFPLLYFCYWLLEYCLKTTVAMNYVFTLPMKAN